MITYRKLHVPAWSAWHNLEIISMSIWANESQLFHWSSLTNLHKVFKEFKKFNFQGTLKDFKIFKKTKRKKSTSLGLPLTEFRIPLHSLASCSIAVYSEVPLYGRRQFGLFPTGKMAARVPRSKGDALFNCASLAASELHRERERLSVRPSYKQSLL